MVVMPIMKNLELIIATVTVLLQTDSEVMIAVQQKLYVDKVAQMTRNNDVEAEENHNLKLDCKSEVQLSDDYAKFCGQFLNILSKFLSI